MNESEEQPLLWYALSAPYRNERKAVTALEEAGMRCFMPMQWVVRTRGTTKKRMYVPVLHNLFFVQAKTKELLAFKKLNNYLFQFLVRPTLEGERKKIIVPDNQMVQFMRVCNSGDDSLRYLEPSEVHLRKGTHVRVIGGVFDGAEGYFQRVKGARNRRFIVAVAGLAAVSVEVEPDLIEVLD